MIIVNKKANKCQSCSKNVPVGTGFAYKNGNRWLTSCASTACHRRLGLTVPARFQTDSTKERKALTEDGQLFYPYDPAALDLLRSFPRHPSKPAWDKENSCRWVSVETKDVLRTIELCDQLGIEVPSSLRNKAEVGTPNAIAALKRAEEKGLYEYQKDGVKFLCMRDRALMADDMGIGKTAQALVALPENARAFVVCPAAVKYNWRNEVEKWRPEFKVTILSGREAFKAPEAGEIVITNYDILPSFLAKDLGNKTPKGHKIFEADFPEGVEEIIKDTHLIADEAHLVKNYKAKRSQKLANVSRVAKAVWFLTGTPLMNNPLDLFGVLQSGGMAREVFGGWRGFLRLFQGIQNRFGGYEFAGPVREVPEIMKRIMIRRMKKEVLKELPDKIYQDILVNNIGSFSKELDALFAECKKLAEELESDFELPSFESFSTIRAKLAESRIPALIELVQDYEEQEQPLLVFSSHKKPVETLAKREGWGLITGDISPRARQDIVDDFQNGKLKGVAMTIRAAGVGITLTRASNILFVDRDWSPAMNIQAEDRAVRIGQRARGVLIKRLVTNHSLDIHINALLDKKAVLVQRALDNAIEFKESMRPARKVDIQVVEETDEQLKARLAELEAAEREAEEQAARDKVHRILDRERTRANSVNNSLPEPELTDNRKALIKEALEYLAGHCDGAVMRDGMGFNRPDAMIGHWIVATGLKDSDDMTFRVAERICSRYYRQLHEGGYDKIWQPEI